MSAVSSLILAKGDTLGRAVIHSDDSGNLYVKVMPVGIGVGAAPVFVVTAAKAASKVISATPGILYSVTAVNTTANDVYLQLFDAAALPANGTVPKDVAAIPAGWSGGIDYGSLGTEFSIGIVAAISSTIDSLTIGGASYLISGRKNP